MQAESLVREVTSGLVEFFGTETRKIDMVDHEGNHQSRPVRAADAKSPALAGLFRFRVPGWAVRGESPRWRPAVRRSAPG